MTVVSDYITHLDNEWNVIITAKPSFLNGHKQLVEGLNYIWVYNTKVIYTDATADGTMRHEHYFFTLKVGSKDSIDKRDDMLEEVNRISCIEPTGYLYSKALSVRHQDTPEGWRSHVRIEIMKLVKLKV